LDKDEIDKNNYNLTSLPKPGKLTQNKLHKNETNFFIPNFKNLEKNILEKNSCIKLVKTISGK